MPFLLLPFEDTGFLHSFQLFPDLDAFTLVLNLHRVHEQIARLFCSQVRVIAIFSILEVCNVGCSIHAAELFVSSA
jgi:hypothetical protein